MKIDGKGLLPGIEDGGGTQNASCRFKFPFTSLLLLFASSEALCRYKELWTSICYQIDSLLSSDSCVLRVFFFSYVVSLVALLRLCAIFLLDSAPTANSIVLYHWSSNEEWLSTHLSFNLSIISISKEKRARALHNWKWLFVNFSYSPFEYFSRNVMWFVGGRRWYGEEG